MRRILTIDGGGIKGTFPAAFLARLEEHAGASITDHFDLIAGTSTGGILAIGLGLGMSARSLLKFYEKHGPEIFAGGRLWREVRAFVLAKYSNAPLHRVLKHRFGDRKLGESRTRLMIPCLNVTQGKVHVFQTSHHPQLIEDCHERAVDIAMASAAAPTFSPSFRWPNGDVFVDGSMWARNPVGMAAVEAVGRLQWHPERIRILSLGCTAKSMHVAFGQAASHGKGFWGGRIHDLFMKAHSSSALHTACLLVGHSNVHRINPDPGEHHFDLDDTRKIPALAAFGRAQADHYWPQLRAAFFDHKAEPFEPCHPLTVQERGAAMAAAAD
jgi:hypothetical protein